MPVLGKKPKTLEKPELQEPIVEDLLHVLSELRPTELEPVLEILV